MQIQAEILLRLHLRLTSCEGHGLDVDLARLDLTIGIRGVERVVKGEVEVGLDLLFLW